MLAANIYEEQTGGISGTTSHPELFLRMMEGWDSAARISTMSNCSPRGLINENDGTVVCCDCSERCSCSCEAVPFEILGAC